MQIRMDLAQAEGTTAAHFSNAAEEQLHNHFTAFL